MCFTAKHMVLTRSENKSWIFKNAALFTHFSDIFRQENPKFFGCFRVGELVRSIRSIIQQFSFTFNFLEDCFHRSFRRRQSVFFHFPWTGKCLENAWKPRVVQRSRVGQRKEVRCFWRFLAVCVEKTRCYRRFTECGYSHAFSSSCRSIVVRKIGIYSYIYRCFTPLTIWTSIDMFTSIDMLYFGEALFSSMKKKPNKTTTTTKTATPFHQSMPVWIKQIMACKSMSAFKQPLNIVAREKIKNG